MSWVTSNLPPSTLNFWIQKRELRLCIIMELKIKMRFQKIFCPVVSIQGRGGKSLRGNENRTPLVSVNMFITCMNALMSLQSLSLCEGFTASLTRKGSFARMNQLKERNANKCILSCSWHVHAGSTGGLQGNRYNENRDPAM